MYFPRCGETGEPVRLDPIVAYKSYSAAWSEKDDPVVRMTLLDHSWSQDGVFIDQETPEGLVGREALSEYIARTYKDMPDLVITDTSEPDVLGNRLRVRWVARQGDAPMYTGTDFVEFAEDRPLSRLTMFYDSTPE